MKREEVRARLEEVAIIPTVRLHSAEDALFAAAAVSGSGIPIVEVTMTVPGAVEVIRELARSHPSLIVGAGTVWDAAEARLCLDAGVKFLTTTSLDLEVVEFALKNDVVAIPGALTPTEVKTAWKAGADFVKIFPCANVGGPDYIRALKGPFAHMRLIASGGVNQRTARDYILAGACAIGVGADLIQQQAIQRREATWIRELAIRFLTIVNHARALRQARQPAK